MATSTFLHIEQRIRETFARLPLLEGITFNEELALVDVELAHCPAQHWSADVHREVTVELLALLEDLDDVVEPAMLRGRTFARAVH